MTAYSVDKAVEKQAFSTIAGENAKIKGIVNIPQNWIGTNLQPRHLTSRNLPQRYISNSIYCFHCKILESTCKILESMSTHKELNNL